MAETKAAASTTGGSGSGDAPKTVREFLTQRVGFIPKGKTTCVCRCLIMAIGWWWWYGDIDAFGWLYACRGLYQLKEYAMVVEGLAHCLRHEKTAKEAQHLLAFSLLHMQQTKVYTYDRPTAQFNRHAIHSHSVMHNAALRQKCNGAWIGMCISVLSFDSFG